MGDGIFKDDVSRREAMKTAMKAGAYAAPVILAASVPGAVGAANMVSNATVTPPATGGGGGPTITGVAPPSGPTTGGTVVTLTGTNFCAGATVTVNGVTATKLDFPHLISSVPTRYRQSPRENGLSPTLLGPPQYPVCSGSDFSHIGVRG